MLVGGGAVGRSEVLCGRIGVGRTGYGGLGREPSRELGGRLRRVEVVERVVDAVFVVALVRVVDRSLLAVRLVVRAGVPVRARLSALPLLAG